jgi:hypothetical protein
MNLTRCFKSNSKERQLDYTSTVHGTVGRYLPAQVVKTPCDVSSEHLSALSHRLPGSVCVGVGFDGQHTVGSDASTADK